MAKEYARQMMLHVSPPWVYLTTPPCKAVTQSLLCRCVNYTAHLGRWAIPVTRDAEDMGDDKVCGIDGCF